MVEQLMPTYARINLSFEGGEGAYLFDSEGQRYLDFASGIAVTVLGHRHPALLSALHTALDRVWHTSNLFRITSQEDLAENLTQNSFADAVFFANSGAEANECLIKTARKYQHAAGSPQRYRIITFEGAFHGRTLATLAAGNQEKHLSGFGPVVDGFDQVVFGDVQAVEKAVTSETAAILIEPIQGEGGIRSVPNDFLDTLRTIADKNSLLLCYDEVQTGIGRTGMLFAHELWGVNPDLMSIAKGLGGGFPVGACLATAEAARGMVAGTHGSTFGGNPLAMAAGNVVVETLLQDGFLARVTQVGTQLHDKLTRLSEKYAKRIIEIRGRGLLLGIRFSSSPAALVDKLRDNGLLTVPASDNVVRLLPPLIIDNTHVEEAIRVLDKTIGDWET